MALAFALVALVAPMAANAAAPTPVLLTQAHADLFPEGLPAQLDQPVRLQHRGWDRMFPGRAGRASFRIELPPTDDRTQLYALLFQRVGNQATVRVNDVVVLVLGTPGDAHFDAAKASHLVRLPQGLLRADMPNRLQVDIAAQSLRAGGLAAVRFATQAQLEPLQQTNRVLDQTTSGAYAACLLLMGGLAAGLWWRQRDALYGCFALMALLGAVRPADRVWLEAPLAWPLWGALLAMAHGAHLALVPRFILLALDQHSRRLLRISTAVLVAVVLAAALSFAVSAPQPWTIGMALLLAYSAVLFPVVLRDALRTRRRIAWIVLGAGGLMIAAGVYDLLRVRIGLFGGAAIALTTHAMFFFVLILAGLIVERYSRSVADVRAANDQLAERVAERERQLGAAFDALRAQQEEHTRQQERQRIMREIHDGVGSQLVGLLNMVNQRRPDRAQLEQHVKLALDEMRMAVDSLQPVDGDLTTVLATLRYRLQARLQAAAIHVVWDLEPLPPLPELSPQAILQVQRILLQAITNVLEHAQASEIVLQARWVERDGEAAVVLRVADNGVGLRTARRRAEGGAERDAACHGQGIASMRSRASSIGATLSLEERSESGTCVVLVWPLPHRAGADTATRASRET